MFFVQKVGRRNIYYLILVWLLFIILATVSKIAILGVAERRTRYPWETDDTVIHARLKSALHLPKCNIKIDKGKEAIIVSQRMFTAWRN